MSSACVSCGNYGALKCLDFCEAKNFRARRRRVPPQERNDAGAVRNAGGVSKLIEIYWLVCKNS